MCLWQHNRVTAWRYDSPASHPATFIFLVLSPTLVLKSGGSVLAPVRRFTRKAFQLEYLCCIPVGKKREHKDAGDDFLPTISRHRRQDGTLQRMLADGLLFGGTRGLPLEAHQPTGCTSGIHRLHQKSLLLSLSKPSYRRRALNPARAKKRKEKTQLVVNTQHSSPLDAHPLCTLSFYRSKVFIRGAKCCFLIPIISVLCHRKLFKTGAHPLCTKQKHI